MPILSPRPSLPSPLLWTILFPLSDLPGPLLPCPSQELPKANPCLRVSPSIHCSQKASCALHGRPPWSSLSAPVSFSWAELSGGGHQAHSSSGFRADVRTLRYLLGEGPNQEHRQLMNQWELGRERGDGFSEETSSRTWKTVQKVGKRRKARYASPGSNRLREHLCNAIPSL